MVESNLKLLVLAASIAALTACAKKSESSSEPAPPTPCSKLSKQADVVAKSGACQSKQGRDAELCMTTVFAAQTAGQGTDETMCESILTELATDEPLRQRLGACGRRQIVEGASWRERARALLGSTVRTDERSMTSVGIVG